MLGTPVTFIKNSKNFAVVDFEKKNMKLLLMSFLCGM